VLKLAITSADIIVTYCIEQSVFIGNFYLGVFEQNRKGTPLRKSAKKFAKIYAVVIVHNKKKVEKFLTRLMLNLQEIQTFDE
jgi:hypothetical protein